MADLFDNESRYTFKQDAPDKHSKWEYYMRRFDAMYFRHPVKGKMVVRGIRLPEPLKYGTRVDVEWGLR